MFRNKPHLVYDKRENKTRINMKMVLPENYDLNEQLHIFNRKLIMKYDESYAFDLSDPSDEPEDNNSDYKVSTIQKEQDLHLPNNVYIHLYNNKKTLVYQKSEDKARLCIRQTLPDNYNIDAEILKLNKSIISKYGVSYAIMNEKINKVHEEQKPKSLPQNIYIQIMNEKPYMVFNKKENNKRMSLSILLPHNYQINKELLRIHAKIVEKYGEQYGFDLSQYHYTEKIVAIPENIYVNTRCEKPYIFMKCDDETTTSVQLPNTYDLETQISNYHSNKPIKNINMMSQQYKDEYKHILPENVSMILKDGKHILMYALRKSSVKHYISLTLPQTFYNLNLQLVCLNKRIVDKYGKEYAVLIHHDS